MSVGRLSIMLRLILNDKNMTLYSLEKKSHISHATLSDLYNEKYNIQKCSVDLIYRISKALDLEMNKLYEILSYQDLKYITYNQEFDVFKSNVCQELKYLGDESFIQKCLLSDIVEKFYNSKDYTKALYLVAMVDYLCQKNNYPPAVKYNAFRNIKLDKLYVSNSIYLLLYFKKTTISEIFKESNIFFLKHNIVEAEIENVY